MPDKCLLANYFDYAAATPVDAEVLAVMEPYYGRLFFNPSATYEAARTVHAHLETARSEIAHWLGARPSEIIFTAGGTESNNLAIHGVMRRFPEGNMITSSIEHSAVLAPSEHYSHQLVPVSSEGIVDVKALADLIDDQTVLVSIMYANNEIGTLQPIREIGRMIDSVRKKRAYIGNALPIYLHTDACQAANYLDLHTARLGVDLMTLNGGKMYGPKQSGVLFVRGGTVLSPIISGGGQERNLRSGTENLAYAVGFAKALDVAQTMRRTETKRQQDLQQYFLSALKTHLPAAIVNGSLRLRLPNNLHITIPGMDNERLLIKLDAVGIMAAAGSACSASDEAASHVLSAIGLSDIDSRASIRFSMGRATTTSAIDYAVTQLAAIVAD
jgi:cysteine desulfurase